MAQTREHGEELAVCRLRYEHVQADLARLGVQIQNMWDVLFDGATHPEEGGVIGRIVDRLEDLERRGNGKRNGPFGIPWWGLAIIVLSLTSASPQVIALLTQIVSLFFGG